MNRFAANFPDDYEDRLESTLDRGDAMRKARKENPPQSELPDQSDLNYAEPRKPSKRVKADEDDRDA